MNLLGLTTSLLLILTSCKETKKEILDLNSLPNEWIRLTEKDGNLVVYNSCATGNMLLTISKNKNDYELLIHGEQEDYDFEVLETTQRQDSIIIYCSWKDSKEKQEFKFIWTDKEKGLGRFITTYSNGFTSDNLFVTKDKQVNFKQYNQPCRECWGDECEELNYKEKGENKKDSLDNEN